ncbi:hypothetical protein CRG98_048854, partial [Punica granatum]
MHVRGARCTGNAAGMHERRAACAGRGQARGRVGVRAGRAGVRGARACACARAGARARACACARAGARAGAGVRAG